MATTTAIYFPSYIDPYGIHDYSKMIINYEKPPKKLKTIGKLFYSQNKAEVSIKIKSFDKLIDFLGFQMWIMPIEYDAKEIEFCLIKQSPAKEVMRLKSYLSENATKMNVEQIQEVVNIIEEIEDPDTYDDWKKYGHSILSTLKPNHPAEILSIAYDSIKLRFELKKPKVTLQNEAEIKTSD